MLTKSPLLLRDLDLMLEIAAVTDIAANLSIPTMDEKPWRASEPHTPSPRARMEAVAELNRAGIPTGILVAPLMPGINDDPRQVERILEAAGEAGAVGVSGIALHLRGRGARHLHGVAAVVPARISSTATRGSTRRGAYAPREEQDRLRGCSRRPPAHGPRAAAPLAADTRDAPAAPGRPRGEAARPGASRRPVRADGEAWPPMARERRGRTVRRPEPRVRPGGRRRCSECVPTV